MSEDFSPTPEQEAIIAAGESALVVAGPGTGKTRTAIHKALLATETMTQDSRRQVLFLSFSNAAVLRLAEASRVHIPRALRKRLRFTTYHALAADILRLYGRFVGLPPRIRIIDKLEERLLALEEEWPDEGADYDAHLKKVACERGFVTFDVMIPLAERLLTASPALTRILARRYPLVVVDEFQDTSQSQWEFLKALGGPCQVVAFGDPNQIIYSSLHAATERRMEEFKEWKGVDVSKFCATNFRCGSAEILEFAEAVLAGRAYAPPEGAGIGCADVQYRNRLRTRLALFWKALRERHGTEPTIGFLAPSNAIAEEIAVGLRAPPAEARVPFPVYARMARDDAANDAVLLALAALRDHLSTPSEQKLKKAAVALLAMDLAWNTRKKRKTERIRRIGSFLETELEKDSALRAAVTKAKRALQLEGALPEFVEALEAHPDFKTSCRRIRSHGKLVLSPVSFGGTQLSLFDSLRETREPKGLVGYDADPGSTHVLNYHRAKGREFDFVALVVDPRGESRRTPIDELRRLYYVCATRAKQGLGVFYYGSEVGRVLGPVIRPASVGRP